jgi:hypothetical protein
MDQPLRSPADASGGETPRRFEDVAAAILAPGGLLGQAEELLKREIETNSADVAAIQRLATIYRCRGDLPAASDADRRIGELQPSDTRAHYLESVLRGRHLPPSSTPQGIWPAPFVRIEGFLSQSQRDLVLELALERQGDLEVAKIGKGEYNPQRRSSWVLSKASRCAHPLVPAETRGHRCRMSCPGCRLRRSRSVRSSCR